MLGKRLYLKVGVTAQGIHNQVQQLVFGDDVLAEQRQALQEVLILLPVTHPLLHLCQTAAFEIAETDGITSSALLLWHCCSVCCHWASNGNAV